MDFFVISLKILVRFFVCCGLWFVHAVISLICLPSVSLALVGFLSLSLGCGRIVLPINYSYLVFYSLKEKTIGRTM